MHSSYPNEHAAFAGRSNDRLEYLGDAVVSLVVSEELWARYPDDDEGLLTARRAAIVSTRGLARVAQRLDLGRFLILGQGADRSGERRRYSVLAATFEAIAAAVYLDLGLETTRRWIVEVAAPELTHTQPVSKLKPPKSRLQEFSFAATGERPEYRVVSAEGPDHAKHYVVEVVLGGRAVATGEGRNRRDAETEAAANALDVLPVAETDAAPQTETGAALGRVT